jgi:ElaB/YqjD/DUF883 family membrane-anchored ribosome-binding protein
MPDAASSGDVDLAKLIEDIEMLKRDFAAIAEKSSAQLTSSAKDAAHRVGAEAQRLYGTVAETGERSLGALSSEVEQRPLTSIAIAFAVGLLSGLALSRR